MTFWGLSAPFKVTTPAVTAMARARRISVMFGSLLLPSGSGLHALPASLRWIEWAI
jgi:hypothetical protein